MTGRDERTLEIIHHPTHYHPINLPHSYTSASHDESSHGMDKSHTLYSIKNPEQIITFDESLLQSVNKHHNENLSDEFARYFSIDDDDVVLLDQSQVIQHEVKSVLNNLINNILIRENHESQIINSFGKRSLDLNNEKDYLLNKKVRFNIPNEEEQQPSTSLFVSETIHSTNRSKPYAQFLYNLGFDLCLEQTLNDNTYISETRKQILIKRNKVFHQYPTYSCKYCSFRTDTIHAINHHYRTPHTLPNSGYPHRKYRCTYCLFETYRLPVLRRHFERKHGSQLISEHSSRRYLCSYCSYESDDKNNFIKHNNRCQIEQTRTRLANNLLAPFDQLNKTIPTYMTTGNMKSIQKNKNQSTTNKLPSHALSSLNTKESLNNNEILEPILIESDHDISSSSSDVDFIVSSDEGNSSSTDDENGNYRDFEIPGSRSKKPQQSTSKPTTSLVPHPFPIPSTSTSASATLSSLSKLLLLNGTSISSPFNATKSSLVCIQPKPTTGNDIYQLCNICQCYIHKKDCIKHMNEKHNNSSTQSRQTISTPITILNNTTNSINTTITCLTPALVVTETATQPSTTIFLLSTSTMDPQSNTLNMIKCPWCDTNFEHIDIMTGHLMRYHRMTLAAAKVVVAEQMKIQGTSSSQLTLMFKEEIRQIQKDFIDKIYWKISQPKVYLHQIDNLSCFVCNINIDDVENHFISSHQIQLTTMNTIKQCCFCGFQCDKKNPSLFEHQLRTHSGVCYSSILKQFIRFEPPPPPLSRTIISKDNPRLVLPSSSSPRRSLTTYTEKKFGCRKCDTSSRLFTFEELIGHLRLNHKLNVKLHRRCIICQQTYVKGKEYNQHCLEHLNDENPSINIERYHMI